MERWVERWVGEVGWGGWVVEMRMKKEEQDGMKVKAKRYSNVSFVKFVFS